MERKSIEERRFTMSVFRIEKNKNYTVMSNHHLRDNELSLKAKGLLIPSQWYWIQVRLKRLTVFSA